MWRKEAMRMKFIGRTDKSRDLNTVTVFPDMDDFILWLETAYEERA